MVRKVTTKTISAKVSLEEYGIICQRAGNANKTVSSYVNELLFGTSTKSLQVEIDRLRNKLIQEGEHYKASLKHSESKIIELSKKLDKEDKARNELYNILTSEQLDQIDMY